MTRVSSRAEGRPAFAGWTVEASLVSAGAVFTDLRTGLLAGRAGFDSGRFIAAEHTKHTPAAPSNPSSQDSHNKPAIPLIRRREPPDSLFTHGHAARA